MTLDKQKTIYNVIKKNKGFSSIIAILIVLDILVVIFKPQLSGIEQLSSSSTLFGLSLQSIILIYIIGTFLLYRWSVTGKNNVSSFMWGISFIFYGITFIGLLLRSFGFSWANDSDPLVFFIWRNFMIIWVCLMYIGTAKILTDSKFWQYTPAIIMLISSYVIFYYGLLILGDIEWTMYFFLYTFWTPLCSIIAYCFWLYGKQLSLASPKIITIGFAVLGITYLGWAPWHFSEVIFMYFIMFFLFNISLAIILLGFVILPYEIASKSRKGEIKD